MIKAEKKFKKVMGPVNLGEPCLIMLETGEVARTSPVEDYFHSFTGAWMIETRNTIYRCS